MKTISFFTRQCAEGFCHLEAHLLVKNVRQIITSYDYSLHESEQDALTNLCSSLLSLGFSMEEISNVRLEWLGDRGSGYPLEELIQVEAKVA